MAEEEKEQEANETSTARGEGEGNEADAAPPANKKKKLVLIGLIAIIILIAIPAGLYFAGIFPSSGNDEAHSSENKGSNSGETTTGEGGHGETGEGKSTATIPDLPPPPVTLELEEFLVNLNTPGKQSRFLKMTIALELPGDAEKEAIKPYIPRVRDTFQLYLRELREEDVKGSAALYRLREELMLRLAKVVYPIKVNDILFKEILTQ